MAGSSSILSRLNSFADANNMLVPVKMTKEELLPYCDAIMTNFFQVLQTKNATCHEEALSASSAIAFQRSGAMKTS